MEEVQANAVPIINALIRAAQRAPTPAVCNFEEGCESCQ